MQRAPSRFKNFVVLNYFFLAAGLAAGLAFFAFAGLFAAGLAGAFLAMLEDLYGYPVA